MRLHGKLDCIHCVNAKAVHRCAGLDKYTKYTMLYQKYTYNYITSFQAEYTTLDNQYTMFDIIQYNMHILLTEM